MARRESTLEQWAVRWARARNIITAKLKNCTGVPDRIFFTPGGKPLVVEFKRKGKKPHKLQPLYLAKLKADGYRAVSVDTQAAVVELLGGRKGSSWEVSFGKTEEDNQRI